MISSLLKYLAICPNLDPSKVQKVQNMNIVKMSAPKLLPTIIVHTPMNNQTAERSMIMHLMSIPRPWGNPLTLWIFPVERILRKLYELYLIIAVARLILSSKAVESFIFYFVTLGFVYLSSSFLDWKVFGVLGFLSVSENCHHLVEAESLFYFAHDVVADFLRAHVLQGFDIYLLLFPNLCRQVKSPHILVKLPQLANSAIHHQQFSHNTRCMASPLRNPISYFLYELPFILRNIINPYIVHALPNVYWFVVLFLTTEYYKITF